MGTRQTPYSVFGVFVLRHDTSPHTNRGLSNIPNTNTNTNISNTNKPSTSIATPFFLSHGASVSEPTTPRASQSQSTHTNDPSLKSFDEIHASQRTPSIASPSPSSLLSNPSLQQKPRRSYSVSQSDAKSSAPLQVQQVYDQLITRVIFQNNSIVEYIDSILQTLQGDRTLQQVIDQIFSETQRALTMYGTWVEYKTENGVTVGALMCQGSNLTVLVLSDRGCNVLKNRASKLLRTLDSELRDTNQKVPSYKDLNKCSERCIDYIHLHIQLEFCYEEVMPHHHIRLSSETLSESDRQLAAISDLADKLRILGIWPRDHFWPSLQEQQQTEHTSGSWKLQQRIQTQFVQYTLADFAFSLRTEHASRERDKSSIWNMPIYEMAISIGREDSITDVTSFIRLCINKGYLEIIRKIKNSDIYTLTLSGYNILSLKDKQSYWKSKLEQWRINREWDLSPLLKAMSSVNSVEQVQKNLRSSPIAPLLSNWKDFAKCLVCMLEENIVKQVFLVPRLNAGLLDRDVTLSNLDEATLGRIGTIRKYMNQDFTLEEIVCLIQHKEKAMFPSLNQVVQDLLNLDQSVTWFTIDEEGTIRREEGAFRSPAPCFYL